MFKHSKRLPLRASTRSCALIPVQWSPLLEGSFEGKSAERGCNCSWKRIQTCRTRAASSPRRIAPQRLRRSRLSATAAAGPPATMHPRRPRAASSVSLCTPHCSCPSRSARWQKRKRWRGSSKGDPSRSARKPAGARRRSLPRKCLEQEKKSRSRPRVLLLGVELCSLRCVLLAYWDVCVGVRANTVHTEAGVAAGEKHALRRLPGFAQNLLHDALGTGW